MELPAFLIRAKKNTYASGEKPKILEDDFEEFVYEEAEFKYRDRYRAQDPKPFGGEEVVWHKGKIAWMMNYYGYVTSKEMGSNDVYGFLRKAMGHVTEDRPFRGPSEFKEGDFTYLDKSEGDIDNFKGTEIILYKGKEVYRLEYHGGAL